MRSVNASCSDVITVPLFFSPPPRTIIPDARPLVTFENQIAVTVRRGISKRSYEKVGDREQSRPIRVATVSDKTKKPPRTFETTKVPQRHPKKINK